MVLFDAAARPLGTQFDPKIKSLGTEKTAE